jgi:hypothetical protein
MIGLMDLTDPEQILLVRIAESVLLDGMGVPRPYWQPSGRNIDPLDYEVYWSLLDKALIEPVPGWCQQVMPDRSAVQLIRWLQGLD